MVDMITDVPFHVAWKAIATSRAGTTCTGGAGPHVEATTPDQRSRRTDHTDVDVVRARPEWASKRPHPADDVVGGEVVAPVL